MQSYSYIITYFAAYLRNWKDGMLGLEDWDIVEMGKWGNGEMVQKKVPGKILLLP